MLHNKSLKKCMNKILKKGAFIIKSIFELLYSFVVYNYYCNKYKDVDYFDYKKLINPKFITPRGFNAVCLYGGYKAIVKLTGKRFNFITDYIEHGTIFSTEPEIIKGLGYYDRRTIRRIYAMSDFNVSVYKELIKNEKLKSQAFAVGPYIQGVDFFYSKSQLIEIKKKYGRILLVFPQHSTEVMQAEYHMDDFIDAIKHTKERYSFNTVFVCLYWADILRGHDDSYLRNDFVVVTAGHRSDPRFLSRQKDLFYLSDHTMSNYLGGYVGYSICMGKPHFLYKQSTKFFFNAKEMIESPSWMEAILKYQELFGDFKNQISSEQYAFIEKYWGKWKND